MEDGFGDLSLQIEEIESDTYSEAYEDWPCRRQRVGVDRAQ
jgi:hypothetical protein